MPKASAAEIPTRVRGRRAHVGGVDQKACGPVEGPEPLHATQTPAEDQMDDVNRPDPRLLGSLGDRDHSGFCMFDRRCRRAEPVQTRVHGGFGDGLVRAPAGAERVHRDLGQHAIADESVSDGQGALHGLGNIDHEKRGPDRVAGATVCLLRGGGAVCRGSLR